MQTRTEYEKGNCIVNPLAELYQHIIAFNQEKNKTHEENKLPLEFYHAFRVLDILYKYKTGV
jgi:hypothetical protein